MSIPTMPVELAADELAIIAALLRFKRTEVLIPEGTQEDLEHIEQKMFDALAKMYRLFPELENYGMSDEPEEVVAKMGDVITCYPAHGKASWEGTLHAEDGEIIAREIPPF